MTQENKTALTARATKRRNVEERVATALCLLREFPRKSGFAGRELLAGESAFPPGVRRELDAVVDFSLARLAAADAKAAGVAREKIGRELAAELRAIVTRPDFCAQEIENIARRVESL